jgi:hypothetical protein
VEEEAEELEEDSLNKTVAVVELEGDDDNDDELEDRVLDKEASAVTPFGVVVVVALEMAIEILEMLFLGSNFGKPVGRA